jgi:hypothetical protein
MIFDNLLVTTASEEGSKNRRTGFVIEGEERTSIISSTISDSRSWSILGSGASDMKTCEREAFVTLASNDNLTGTFMVVGFKVDPCSSVVDEGPQKAAPHEQIKVNCNMPL